MSKFVCCKKKVTNFMKEIFIRLDSTTPTQSILASTLGLTFDSLSITNLSFMNPNGDFTPFLGQDPQNNNVVIVEILYNNQGNNIIEKIAITQGTRLITREDASIVEILSIGVASDIDAVLLANSNNVSPSLFNATGVPTTPINLLFTFDVSENV